MYLKLAFAKEVKIIIKVNYISLLNFHFKAQISALKVWNIHFIIKVLMKKESKQKYRSKNGFLSITAYLFLKWLILEVWFERSYIIIPDFLFWANKYSLIIYMHEISLEQFGQRIWDYLPLSESLYSSSSFFLFLSSK